MPEARRDVQRASRAAVGLPEVRPLVPQVEERGLALPGKGNETNRDDLAASDAAVGLLFDERELRRARWPQGNDHLSAGLQLLEERRGRFVGARGHHDGVEGRL